MKYPWFSKGLLRTEREARLLCMSPEFKEVFKQIDAVPDVNEGGKIGDRILDYLNTEGKIDVEEIANLRATIIDRLRQVPDLKDMRMEEFNALVSQIPAAEGDAIAWLAVEAGVLDREKMANAMREGAKNAPKNPDRPLKTEAAKPESKEEDPKTLLVNIERAKARMKEFESRRYSLVRMHTEAMRNLRGPARLQARAQMAAQVRQLRYEYGDPVAQYWQARGEYEQGTGMDYGEELRIADQERRARISVMAENARAQMAAESTFVVDTAGLSPDGRTAADRQELFDDWHTHRDNFKTQRLKLSQKYSDLAHINAPNQAFLANIYSASREGRFPNPYLSSSTYAAFDSSAIRSNGYGMDEHAQRNDRIKESYIEDNVAKVNALYEEVKNHPGAAELRAALTRSLKRDGLDNTTLNDFISQAEWMKRDLKVLEWENQQQKRIKAAPDSVRDNFIIESAGQLAFGVNDQIEIRYTDPSGRELVGHYRPYLVSGAMQNMDLELMNRLGIVIVRDHAAFMEYPHGLHKVPAVSRIRVYLTKPFNGSINGVSIMEGKRVTQRSSPIDKPLSPGGEKKNEKIGEDIERLM